MPKIVDHAQRRDQIAQVACRVVAAHGFEQATIVRIARAAGYTTGMLAHYFDSKQEIILAALRLIMRRMEQRLTQPQPGNGSNLYTVLSEALPIYSGGLGNVAGDQLKAASDLGERKQDQCRFRL